MDEDGARFAAWFWPWKQARPDVISPIGWYVLADLEAAFTAGRADQHQQTLDEILERTRALEAVVRAMSDRPGTPPTIPPAGPVPGKEQGPG